MLKCVRYGNYTTLLLLIFGFGSWLLLDFCLCCLVNYKLVIILGLFGLFCACPCTYISLPSQYSVAGIYF